MPHQRVSFGRDSILAAPLGDAHLPLAPCRAPLLWLICAPVETQRRVVQRVAEPSPIGLVLRPLKAVQREDVRAEQESVPRELHLHALVANGSAARVE